MPFEKISMLAHFETKILTPVLMQIQLANLDFTLMNQNKFFQFIEKKCEVTVKTIFFKQKEQKKTRIQKQVGP